MFPQSAVRSYSGKNQHHTLDHLKECREQQVAFTGPVALLKTISGMMTATQRMALSTNIGHHKRLDGKMRPLQDNVFPQYLMLAELSHAAAGKIKRAIEATLEGEKTIQPSFSPTTPSAPRVTWILTPLAQPIPQIPIVPCSHVSKIANGNPKWPGIEEMDEVACYVKNQNLGFSIPYTLNGEEKAYYLILSSASTTGMPTL